MISFFEKYWTELASICKAHHVERLYAFGSVLTKQFKKESDVDLIVAFRKEMPVSYFQNYFKFKQELESLFGRKVDLMEEHPIRNPVFREEVKSTKQLLYYGQKSQKVAV